MGVIPASENVFPILRMSEGAAPATPPTGEAHLYVKSDGLLYWKDDAGTEYPVDSGGAAGLSAHLADTTDAHDASAISIADAGTYFTGTDVEAALQELGAGAGGGGGGGTFTTPTIIQAARANGTNTIAAMSAGQRIIVGIVSFGGTVTGVACTNVTFTHIGTDLTSGSNKISVWVGVATGTSGTSVTFTGSGTIINMVAVVADALTPTLGTQWSSLSAGGFVDVSARSNITAGQFFVVVGMTDNTASLVFPFANCAHTALPTSLTVQNSCMALGYAPTGDIVVAARSNATSSGAVYAVSIT